MAEVRQTKRRGMSTEATVMVAIGAALAVAMLVTNWAMVEVRTVDGRDTHLRVPIPLNLVRVPLRVTQAFIPNVRVPLEMDRDTRRLLRALQELQNAEDGSFVDIQTHDGDVRLGKLQDELVVTASADGTRVRCTVPWSLAERVVAMCERGDVDPLEAIEILIAAGRGSRITVDGPGAGLQLSVF